MVKSISQIHQAALAFRTQFRPLIELLDDIAELDGLENTRRDLETAVEKARKDYTDVSERRDALKARVKNLEAQIKTEEQKGEAQQEALAAAIKAQREEAEAEAERIRAEVSAGIGKEQAEAAARLAEVEAAIVAKQQEASILDTRLEMLRKAIAGIVAGSEGP